MQNPWFNFEPTKMIETFHRNPYILALATIWATVAMIGAAILLLPEKPKIPLVAHDGWSATGFAQSLHPQIGDISRSIIENPSVSFWTNWHPDGTTPGVLKSAPFLLPRVLAVPMYGYPGEPGLNVYLQCLSSGSRRQLAQGNMHETWVERTLWMPPSWCPTAVILVAESSSSRRYVAVGTPMVSSRLSWLKQSVFSITVAHAFAWALLLCPGLAFLSLIRVKSCDTRMAAAIPVTLLLGYLTFFAGWYANHATQFLILMIFLTCGATIAYSWRGVTPWIFTAEAAPAFTLAFTISLAYAYFMYAGDLGIGSWTATYRFDPAIWSTDSQLSQMVADGVYYQRPIATIIGGGWHVSDRPPLLAGLMLLARPMLEPMLSVGDNQRFSFLFYQVLGLVACSLWIVPAWFFFQRSTQSKAKASVGTVLMATTGFIAFNSVYIWPKMLAGAISLAAYLVWTDGNPDDGSHRVVVDVIAGVLFGLAVASHSGVAFGIVPVFLVRFLRSSMRARCGVVVAGLSTIVIMLPWILWQRFVDPPGNALLKFALAGTFGMGEETKSVSSTVIDAYHGMSVRLWLTMHQNALLTLIGQYDHPIIQWFWQRPMDAMGRLRAWEFMYLLPALAAANFGWTMLAFKDAWVGTSSACTKTLAKRWLLLGLLGVAMASVLNFGVNINHTQSYFSLLLIFIALYSLILAGPLWLRVVAGSLNLIYFVTVWVWSPLRSVDVRWNVAVGGVVATVAVVLVLCHQVTPAPFNATSLNG